ncbi:MAG: N-acetyltransferase [Bdellovibrionota bacterium]
MAQIKPVQSPSDWSEFIDFQWKIYARDPNWVPNLRIAIRDMLDVRKNPFFKHATMLPLLARNDRGEVVGRIVGVIDEAHNQFQREKTAFFGFFECVDDQKTASALLNAVGTWARERGMSIVRGPAQLSSNHEWGLLIEGFDDPAYIMMTYNPPYYAKLIEGWGGRKAKDLYAYVLEKRKSKFAERLLAQAERLKAKENITFREVNMSDFDGEVNRILEVYNDAWEKNWGFVPMDEEEFRHMAKDMKMVLDPRLLLMAEIKGEPAAFALCLPDVHQVFKKVPDGKLFPTGIFKLLWNLKGPGRARTVTRCRILTLGIKQKYKLLGLGPLFYTEYFKRGVALGYQQAEASWILEDNKPMNKALELMGATRSKVYRLYDRAI